MNSHRPAASVRLEEVCQFLEHFAPAQLAEDWDNVGLLVGHRAGAVQRVMTCLTITPESVAEAIGGRVDLIVTHHPLPFRPLKRITDATVPGRLLLEIIQHQIAVYSPHTAFDSAARGINQRLSECLALQGVRPLRPATDEPQLGTGRIGQLAQPMPVAGVAQQLKTALGLDQVRIVDSHQTPRRCVGLACGSGGELMSDAHALGCDLFITGETSFHSCLEAQATGMGLILLGHFASERFAVEALAAELQQAFPDLEIWPSSDERNPWTTV